MLGGHSRPDINDSVLQVGDTFADVIRLESVCRAESGRGTRTFPNTATVACSQRTSSETSSRRRTWLSALRLLEAMAWLNFPH